MNILSSFTHPPKVFEFLYSIEHKIRSFEYCWKLVTIDFHLFFLLLMLMVASFQHSLMNLILFSTEKKNRIKLWNQLTVSKSSFLGELSL